MPDDRVLHVLEKIDIQLYAEEILAIIGPSGCGKSTLIRILAGLIPPTRGHVLYHGKKITGLLPHFSLVFQNFALFPWMTVKKNIEVVLTNLHLSKDEIQTRANDVIALIGLSGFEEAYPREISGGMKQRVGLARALARDPEILLLDEPFSSLDAFTAETLRRELVNIWETKAKGPRSILIISHDVREVAYLADRIVMMETNPGKVRFVMENKLPRPRNYHSQEFTQLVDRLHDAYTQEEAPCLEPITPLLPVSPEEILGFLSYLHRFGESSDLYQIGSGSMEHFNRVLMDAEAAERLNFVEIDKRKITISETGKRFLHASAHSKRSICKEQLLLIPLFQKAIEWLSSAPKHLLSYKELAHLISLELPRKDAKEQSKTLLSWGAYGNLFILHKASKTVSFAASFNKN
jgi:NitT/TauT family transport system ATP-binding protein